MAIENGEDAKVIIPSKWVGNEVRILHVRSPSSHAATRVLQLGMRFKRR